MEQVLSEQPQDTWDSFPLFQVLNDYLRTDDNLKNGRFHQQIRDTFAPQVIRYVDLMESSIAQSIHKGFEKERWEMKGYKNLTGYVRPCQGRPSAGCATSEDLFWKLDALQSFIRDLHWPDPEFGLHLNQRLKLMACDMIESSIQRTFAAFEQHLSKGILLDATTYIIPIEICSMVNVVLDAKTQALKLCGVDGADMHKYHTKIDEQIEKTSFNMRSKLVGKLITVLEKTLGKLSAHDEGTMMGGFFNKLNKVTNVSGNGTDLGKSYIQFVRTNMDVIGKRVNDDLWVLSAMEKWYFNQVQMLSTWLTERLDKSLNPYQCTCLSYVVKKLYTEYELQGMEGEKLNTNFYCQVAQRMATEEATCVLSSTDAADIGTESDDERDKERRRKQIEARKRAKAAGQKLDDDEESRLQRQQSRGPVPGPPSKGPPQRGMSQQGRGPTGPNKPPPTRQKTKKMDSDDSSDSGDEAPQKKPPPPKGKPPAGKPPPGGKPPQGKPPQGKGPPGGRPPQQGKPPGKGPQNNQQGQSQSGDGDEGKNHAAGMGAAIAGGGVDKAAEAGAKAAQEASKMLTKGFGKAFSLF